MEKIYRCYTKKSGGRLYYFVKTYRVYPEIKKLAPILDCYGMHENFDRACSIAKIGDLELRKQLYNQLHNGADESKIVGMNKINSPIKMIFLNLQQLLQKAQ